MARAVYQHELQDPDFSWLVNRFQELNPQYLLVESSVQPLVFVLREPPVAESAAGHSLPTVPPPSEALPLAKRG